MPSSPATAVRTLLPALGLTLLLAACDDATGPEGDVTVHFARAAPGAGPLALSIDDEILADGVDAGDAVVRTVPGGRHTVSLEGADEELVAEVLWNAQARPRFSLVVMNGADPVMRTFPAAEISGAPVAVAFRVINAVPADASLTFSLRVVGGSGGISANLDYGTSSGSFGLGSGTYTASAHFGDPDAAVELGQIALDRETRFIVIGPDESGTAPGFVTAF